MKNISKITIAVGTVVTLKSDSLNRGSITCDSGDWGWLGRNVGKRKVGDIIETTMEENNGPGWVNRVKIRVTNTIAGINYHPADNSGYGWQGEIIEAIAKDYGKPFAREQA